MTRWGLTLVVLMGICCLHELSWAAGAGNVVKTDDQGSVQTATTLWTPASGKQIVLNGCALSGGVVGNRMKVQSGGTDVIPNQASVVTNTVSIVGNPLWVGTTNSTLTYTTTSVNPANTSTIMCWGYEQTP